jgi:hypothetical protein
MSRALYRTAAVLILLLGVGHSAGYPWSDPAWGVDLHTIQTSRFDVLGFSRTYWDFYVGFGLSVGVLLAPIAILTWQLGSVPMQAWPALRGMAWTLALCFAGLTVLDWMYFFTIPVALSALITACLTAAAWLSGRDRPMTRRGTS